MFSYFDVPNDERRTSESFYHAFVLGLVTYLKDEYYIHSNRESGFGRYDLCLESKKKSLPSFIFEFKLLETKDIETIIREAKDKMNTKKYVTNLKEKGITNIHKFIFVFRGKEVTIKEVA